jgi:hypothetical protein
MSQAEDLVGMPLRGRYRLEAVVTETPESLVFAGVDSQAEGHVPIVVRMARALRGMSNEELVEAFDRFAIEAEQLAQVTRASPNTEPLLTSGELTHPTTNASPSASSVAPMDRRSRRCEVAVRSRSDARSRHSSPWPRRSARRTIKERFTVTFVPRT